MSVRRPLVQAANALQAETDGTTEETQNLLTAFDRMQCQVQAVNNAWKP